MGYVVQPGDSGTRIAGILYGDQRMFQNRMAANPGISALPPGMNLNTPAGQSNPVVTVDPASLGPYGTNPYSQEGQYLLSTGGQGPAASNAGYLASLLTGGGDAQAQGKGASRQAYASLFVDRESTRL